MDGAELRRRRRALGLTQQQLAERLDVARETVTRWETGALAIESPGMLHYALLGLACERGHRRDEGGA